ncbi:hypothetical protein [Sedimentibacter sp. B4]|uniref:hypothetical protein n=1 Tax=Sedimentibacter sp. B4 TaxID=304766 RepID=UPI00030A0C76|nr:hypothetical protein [Sedimentibacter sp. B4]
MNYKLFNSCITDTDIDEILENKIKFEEYDTNDKYDISVDFYNQDLQDEVLNDNVSFEIKRNHYLFIKKVRDLFELHNIKINKFFLMGTILELDKDEMLISVLKSNHENKSNTIWPCKEIFIFEDSKNKLDDLLFNNQISEEDYESNLEFLKDELSIYDNEDEHGYLN